MNDKNPIISVRNLTKTYQIGSSREKYKRLSESVTDALIHPGQWLLSRRIRNETFYALHDVSFDIYPGEVVGIIGRNGAGKSTLLKILSGITYPSSGEIELNGRVGSLLEVGTGFHPELTGRENIYFNGSVLGMTRREVDAKFDDISNFAGIEGFLDTPVKRYSSGMAVRLGFAVAAHLNPEILVVDEVLAVGDAEFQKKCLGKMGEVAKAGRTVLFVSHNMGAIKNLCSKSLLLDNGEIRCFDETSYVIQQYGKGNLNNIPAVELSSHKSRKGSGVIKYVFISLYNQFGENTQLFSIGDTVIIELTISSNKIENRIISAIEIRSLDGINICNIINIDSKFNISVSSGITIIQVLLEDIRLYPDNYSLNLWISGSDANDPYDYIENCASFRITDGGKLTNRKLERSTGLFFFTPKWKIIETSSNK